MSCGRSGRRCASCGRGAGSRRKALGFRGDLHRNYVGGIERGELNITFRVLLKVARGLNVPLSELVAMYERNLTVSQLLR